MHITHLHLKNFRCFKNATFDLNAPLVVIEGSNGSGKTSLLEALHYACYLRSFRTYSPQELLLFDHENFFVKIQIQDELTHELQVGFAQKKRLAKVDQQSVSSYKQLMEHYRAVTLTEDDVQLVKGAPEQRRLFIDQVLLLLNPEFTAISRQFKHILDNRNALLRKGGSSESYEIWTQQLWQASKEIQLQRTSILQVLTAHVHELVTSYFGNAFTIQFSYLSKVTNFDSYDAFMAAHMSLYHEERHAGRSLFGAHLDDFAIAWQDKKSRSFASRGQQKLIVLLLKMAQVKELLLKKGSTVFLLDDFMTDFDQGRTQILLQALSDLSVQLIFTSPESTFLGAQFTSKSHLLKLTP